MWMDAADDTTFSYSSGTTVSQWRDKSGLNNHCTPLTAGPTRSSVLNSRKVLAFTTGQSIGSLSFTMETSANTVFVVSRLTGGTNSRVLTAYYNNWLLGHWGGYINPYYAEGWVYFPVSAADTVWRIHMGDWGGPSNDLAATYSNGTVLTSQIINYTALSQDPNYYLILHTTITLGYDVPWRKVHQVLIDAAIATNNILTEPIPFVLQTSLDDFYVSYELNAYSNKPMLMANIYSELHQNIQDKCNEAGIEILSPHYSAVRDGNQTTIPENYLSEDYKAPGFRLSSLNNLFNPDNSKNTPDL
jgi:hypothetical protein